MGHHIDEQGRFQSDRHPDLPPDHILISAKHPEARAALACLAASIDDGRAVGGRKAQRIYQALDNPEVAATEGGVKFSANFTDPTHRPALAALAFAYVRRDRELAKDIMNRLMDLEISLRQEPEEENWEDRVDRMVEDGWSIQ